MNAHELTHLLERAAKAPLAKLSAADITRTGSAVTRALAKVEQIEAKEALLALERSVPSEDRGLFDSLRRQESKRTKDALAAARAARDECSRIASRLRPLLRELRSSDEAAALALLAGFSSEELSWLSFLANVSDANGKLVKYSPRTRNAWLAGLGIKVSGVGRAGQKKRR